MDNYIIAYFDHTSIFDAFDNKYTNLRWEINRNDVRVYGVNKNRYGMFVGRVISFYAAELESIPYTGPLIDIRAKSIFS